MKKLIYFVLLMFVSNAYGLKQEDLLQPDDAFKLTEPSYEQPGVVIANWKIAEDYYLYKKTFKFTSSTPDVELGEPVYPESERIRDLASGKQVDIYKNDVSISVPVTLKKGVSLPEKLELKTEHQGCSDKGVCYPPAKKTFTLQLASNDAVAAPTQRDVGGGLMQKLGIGGGANEPIPVDEAFKFELFPVKEGVITAYFGITPDHYLYQEKFKFRLVNADGAELGEAQYPKGVMKNDPYFGEIEVYETDTRIELPITGTLTDAAALKVEYQGCAELTGICYPPVKKTLRIPQNTTQVSLGSDVASESGSAAINNSVSDTAQESESKNLSEQDRLADRIKNNTFIETILLFFGLGILLALTPCVFPMIPILSGIIAGQSGYLSAKKAFMLSLAYVIPMALTYAIVGVIAGLTGANLQAAFQSPWVIISFVVVLALLSLSMFGFYELQMPSRIQTRLTEISNRQQGGNFIGAGIMGVLSALIVSPCVTAPLIAALIYIADTKDAVLGGAALFALGMGMGTPLLAIGTSAGKLLPRAGAWMDATKAIFGVMMLGLAIWMLDRIIPAEYTLLLTGILLLVSSLYAGALDPITEKTTQWQRFWKGIGLVMMMLGALMIIGTAMGNNNLLKPVQFNVATGSVVSQQQAAVSFEKIKGVDGLNLALDDARESQQISMLDFYADWCVSCKELEQITFKDERVVSALSGVKTLKTDVTANDQMDADLMKQFNLFGPPALLFFKADGTELKDLRLVGFIPPEAFLSHLDKVRASL